MRALWLVKPLFFSELIELLFLSHLILLPFELELVQLPLSLVQSPLPFHSLSGLTRDLVQLLLYLISVLLTPELLDLLLLLKLFKILLELEAPLLSSWRLASCPQGTREQKATHRQTENR